MTIQTMIGTLLLGFALPVLAAQAPAGPAVEHAIEAPASIAQPAAETAPAEEVAGFITIRDAQEKYCTIPVPVAGSGLVRRYEFHADGSPCAELNNKGRTIAFEGLPSATRILLTDSDTCKITGEPETIRKFWVSLKTTRKVTLTEGMQMSYFFGSPNNAIIHPGLMLVDKFLDGDSVAALDALSCITITTSRATLPKPVAPITFTDLQYETVAENNSKFHCNDNRVLLGRGHQGDDYAQTEYLCGTPMQGTREVRLEKNKEGPGVHGETHQYICPINTLMTGREHDGNTAGETRYWCAEAWLGQERLEVLTDDHWYGPHPENSHKFRCNGDRVLAGMSKYGDKDGNSWYRCARLYQLSPP